MHVSLPPWVALYVFWNFVGFIMIMEDKRRASQGKWRIRERTFFLWASAFGAAGILLGMYMFRHKSRHWSFVVGVPLLGLANLGGGYLLWRQGWFL